MIQFDNVPKFGTEGLEAAMKSFSALSKGAQTVAAETAAFAKRSFEQSTETLEKLAGVRTLDKALSIQSDYVRTSYENLVAQASKVGELVTTTTREAYAPVEALVSKRPQPTV